MLINKSSVSNLSRLSVWQQTSSNLKLRTILCKNDSQIRFYKCLFALFSFFFLVSIYLFFFFSIFSLHYSSFLFSYWFAFCFLRNVSTKFYSKCRKDVSENSSRHSKRSSKFRGPRAFSYQKTFFFAFYCCYWKCTFRRHYLFFFIIGGGCNFFLFL